MSSSQIIPSPPSRRTVIASACVTLALVIAAYWGTTNVPFLLDDASAITNNASIRELWPLASALHPPSGSTVTGRPLLNFSYAINHAIGGLNPAGYHVFNLAVHLAAAAMLFGLLRRTLLRPVIPARLRADAWPIAFVVTALWTLDPLQTISVTYISQRAESMMGFCYLLTLYALARAATSPQPWRWKTLSVAACVLGLGCKEVMITVPVIAFLYDRTFLAGNFRAAWRTNRGVYVGLGAICALAAIKFSAFSHQDIGFGLGVRWYHYAWLECEVVVRYLGLSVFPYPLVFDYGEQAVEFGATSFLFGITLVGLLAGTAYLLKSRPLLGFLGAWFFVILAPTSTVVPIVHQPMAENRLYLPLAAVVAGIVIGARSRLGRSLFGKLAMVILVGFAALTYLRNVDYRSEIGLWRDTLARVPANARAHYNLGHALVDAHQTTEAVTEYETALKLRPDYAEAHNNLANAFALLGKPVKAIPHYETALRLNPAYSSAQYNLAVTLVELNRVPEAIAHFEGALRLEPAGAGIHYNLASALARAGRTDEAIAHFSTAIKLSPNYPEAHLNWGNLLAQTGDPAGAIDHYQAALKQNPRFVETYISLGNLLYEQHRISEAIEHYKTALRIRPDSAAANYNLGNVLLAERNYDEAIVCFEAARRAQPTLAGAHHNLALALMLSGRPAEALPHYEEALRLAPSSATAHHNFATALAHVGRIPDAIRHEEEAIRLQRDFQAARVQLEQPRK